jgi:hypothetical protein
MDNIGHTPGPWKWVETPSAHSLDYPSNAPDIEWDGISPLQEYPMFDKLSGANNKTILDGFWCNDSTAEIGVSNAADARLIAAAPDMYNELFRALAVIRNPQAFDIDSVASDIERVLDAAKGEK